MDCKGLVRKLFDRSNDVSSVRLVNKSLGNVPCRPNPDTFLKVVMKITITTLFEMLTRM